MSNPENPFFEKKDELWQKAYNSLTRYLANRDHSEKELKTKLSQKYPHHLVNEMIQLAHDHHWLAQPLELSERTAERLYAKGKGFLYINQYLKEKGLPSILKDSSKELKIAQEVVQLKFGDITQLEFKDKPKVLRFLMSRGFDNEIANSILFKSREKL